jgi:formylglycine-generating enzyme required for sulfatase activity
LRAGVLPALRARAELVQKELVSIVMVPRDRPIAALRRALLSANEGRDADRKRVWAQAVKDALPDTLPAISEDALARLLRRLAADGRVPVLLVDQLEEAAGVGAKAQGEARVFLSLLAAAASSAKTDGSIVLATARVDLIAALLEFGSIQSVFRSDSWPIGSIPAERLVRVVLEPLRGRKVKIASGLPEIILADVGNEPGALALLSQVLTTLWDERSRFGNALTKDGYEKAGRVSGALQRQAEAAVAEACTLDPDAEKRVFRLFRALATNVGTQGFTRRTVRLGALASELGTSTDELRAMVRPFVARHLLVLSGEIGEDTIEVAHEQLFKAWPELADVLASHREAIELRREITDAATGWDSSGRKSEFWSDETSRLRQGEEFLRDGRLDLDQLGREFLVACRARVARRRRLELAAVGVMALLALGAGWFAFDAHNARGVAEIEKQNAQAEAKRAEENEKKALAEAARALDAEAIAKRQATSTLSLRAVLQFAELEDRVDELWPATPDRLDAYESWIAEAKLLINGRSGAEADPQKRLLSLTNYEEALADLRKRARPLTAEEKELDRRKSKYFEQFLGEQKHVEAHDKLPTTPATKREFDAESKRLHEALDSLAADVNTRRTFNFDDLDDRWWNGQLSKLVTDLTNLDKAENGGLCSTGMTPTHGWGIPRRVEAARQIEEDSIIGADARKKWADAIASIRADRRFEHLELTPQFGLLPIERDPDSQLWEFAHLQTGEAPRRVDGRLKLTERTGLVFVLIPGGTTFLGAQAEEREGRNFDPQTAEFDRPPAQFALKPYFISKYEMTQAQWLRFTGHNPSYYGPQRSNKSWVNWNRDGKAWSSRHPVESVSWNDCDRVLRWLGLALPTEEQWENAARAGEPGPWYTGSDLRALRGAANLLDEPWNDLNSATQNIEPFDDGHEVHAEVGNYRANAFGLFDMCGNVSEWCEDVFGNEARAAVDGDNAGTCYRARRGGSFNDLPPAARSAYRAGYAPTTTSVEVGVRPARPVN